MIHINVIDFFFFFFFFFLFRRNRNKKQQCHYINAQYKHQTVVAGNHILCDNVVVIPITTAAAEGVSPGLTPRGRPALKFSPLADRAPEGEFPGRPLPKIAAISPQDKAPEWWSRPIGWHAPFNFGSTECTDVNDNGDCGNIHEGSSKNNTIGR